MLRPIGCGTASCCAGKCVDAALLILRLAAGIIFVYHGWGKLFGEPGVAGFTAMLTQLSVPLPAVFAWIVSILEFFGGIGLIVGVLVRPIAALLAVDMLVAFLLVKQALPAGDPDVALFAIAVTLALIGGGAYALMRPKAQPPAPSA